jgi:hypothetical protein
VRRRLRRYLRRWNPKSTPGNDVEKELEEDGAEEARACRKIIKTSRTGCWRISMQEEKMEDRDCDWEEGTAASEISL